MMFQQNLFFVLFFLISTIAIPAKPIIEFDTKEYDCGKYIEGSVNKIEAIFNVKNSGDEPLKLKKVRPSCGCTVVKFDSLVQPGGSTAIKSTVNIKGRKGMLRKAVTVTSNSEQDSIVRLIIKTTIVEPISSTPSFIILPGNNHKKKTTVTLLSPKKDLKVEQVVFKSDVKNKKEKKKNAETTIPYSFSIVDTVRNDSLHTFNLKLQSSANATTVSGQFILTTNHPDRKEMKIRGKISN